MIIFLYIQLMTIWNLCYKASYSTSEYHLSTTHYEVWTRIFVVRSRIFGVRSGTLVVAMYFLSVYINRILSVHMLLSKFRINHKVSIPLTIVGSVSSREYTFQTINSAWSKILFYLNYYTYCLQTIVPRWLFACSM